MRQFNTQRILQIVVLTISITLIAWAAPEMLQRLGWELDMDGSGNQPADYIVQGRDVQAVSVLVIQQGGEVTRALPRLNAVGARLTTGQIRILLNSKTVTQIFEYRAIDSVKLAGNFTASPPRSLLAN